MRKFVSLVALVALAGVAQAQDISQVNGYHTWGRLFDDFAGSQLTINGVNTPSTGMPGPELGAITGQSGPVHFIENFAQGEPGNFANKHVAWLSTDSGASRMRTNIGQSFTMEFNVNMTVGSLAPRKEAGVEIWMPRGLHDAPSYNDEGQILIASDGEVAVFGGTMPFTGFGPAAYTAGTTAHVSFRYFAPGIHDPNKGAYQLVFTDAVTGVHDSGIKIWGAEFDGIAGMRGAYLGLKDQNQRNPFIADSANVLYSNISIVPAPAALGLIGLAGLAGTRRRR
ncbi:MAG TPA: hypothetical protein VHN77_13280 [Phycisphaerales bacterium]|nr:hypothetical protein [Phycisphaerales bacterium]